MRLFDLLSSLLRHLPALLLVGVFALMTAGVTVDCCADELGDQEKTAHVHFCNCSCRQPMYMPETTAQRLLVDQRVATCPTEVDSFLPDAEPSGIFRPPKHLV